MKYLMIYAIASIVLVSLYALFRYKKIKQKVTGHPFWISAKMIFMSKVTKVSAIGIVLVLIVLFLIACPIIAPFFIIKKIRSLFKKKEVKPTGYANVPKFFTEADNSVGPIDLDMD